VAKIGSFCRLAIFNALLIFLLPLCLVGIFVLKLLTADIGAYNSKKFISCTFFVSLLFSLKVSQIFEKKIVFIVV